MKFYNRSAEIAELRRIRELSFSKNSRMTVVTGRRRIGKTSLIKEALDDDTAPMLYFFTGRKTEAALVDDFTQEVREKLKAYVPDGLIGVAAVIKHLFELAKTMRFTLVIDEFQEFQNINPTLFSDLQNLWDSYRAQTHMNLLLSGSVLSMMKKIFTDAHEPLFGRADNIIHLRPFKIAVIKEILSDYNPGYSSEDLLALYTITGGIPKYIELLCDNGYVTADAMLGFTASDMSPFIEEGRNLLITEFGRDYGTYFSILLTISEGYTSQGEITSVLGGQSIGGYLEKLENIYGLISKYRPIFSKPGSKNTVRFRITDNFLQFWFRFIERNRPMIELDNHADLAAVIKAQYPTYSGIVLERYFRQKLAEEGGFREIGSWWERKAGSVENEIDIVGIRTDGKHALVAEVKRKRGNYSHKDFMEKVKRLQSLVLAKYEIETRLFTMENM
ncbi:MAG: AAA family ATPase [Bacteroidales bacterium]|nr:AAA family ATPase [Bacteroidales bacterium]